MNDSDSPTKLERAGEELRNYSLISFYLFVCLSVVLLYEASLQNTAAVDPLPWSIALVKALVFGKFILIGSALSAGARADSYPLLHRVVWKSLAMLLLLIVFTVLEEVIVGWFHDRSVSQLVDEFLQRSLLQDIAPLLLMLLILIPLITATEIYRAMDNDRFRQVVTGK